MAVRARVLLKVLPGVTKTAVYLMSVEKRWKYRPRKAGRTA